MDDYGYFQLQDASVIAENLLNGDNVVFDYNLGNGTTFVISIFPHFKAMNRISNGCPYGRIFVGIMFRGYFHFDPTIQQYPEYVGGKLNLNEPEAPLITNLLNAIFLFLR